ncbi:MAG TPA: hypothetical protein VGL22_00245 [Terracidiphilus sp.]|jgi:hypothetical protein
MKLLRIAFMLSVVALSPLAPVCQTMPALQFEGGPPAEGGVPQERWIPRNIRVKLRLLDPLNTATHHRGDVVHLELASDAVADGVIVLPAGTPATATITRSQAARGKQPGVIDFSDPELVVAGEKIRLVPYNPNEEWEDGPGIVLAVAIAAPVLAAMFVAVLPVAGVVHLVRRHHKKPPEHDVGIDPGMTLTYYTRQRTLLKIAAPVASTP